MDKGRGKQQNVSVTGLFKLAGRHTKMDDVFVYRERQSTGRNQSTKENKQTNKLNHER